MLSLALDVTDDAQIAAAVDAARERFGRVDVLVNNAGYGYQASIEEGEDAEIRAQFDANVFGLFALTRAVLPLMRAQGGGHVINITSVAGLVGFPGSGYYAASKHAVEGWSDALAAEVAPLGLHVTCVEPGPFRTDWAGRSLRQTPVRIDAYQATVGQRMESTRSVSGRQAGDPERAAAAIIPWRRRPNRHGIWCWGLGDRPGHRAAASPSEGDRGTARGSDRDRLSRVSAGSGEGDPAASRRRPYRPTIPPSVRVMTIVADRGRLPAAVPVWLAGQLLLIDRALPSSPGCWMLTNSEVPSGVEWMPVISHCLGPTRKRRRVVPGVLPMGW